MKLRALLQINQEYGDIFEPGKKSAQLSRSKLCRLSSAIHAVEKLHKTGEMSQMVGVW